MPEDNRSGNMSESEMLAEGEGFEPPVELPPQWFSRPPPSTTRPSLRGEIRPDFLRNVWKHPNSRPCVTVGVTHRSSRDASGHTQRPLL
jgi:hypothetical protein